MSTPQTAITPDTCTSAIFIEADILTKPSVQAACNRALSALARLQQAHPEDNLCLTIAFGADFWSSLNRSNEAAELKNFRPLGQGSTAAPSTQHDLLIHIQSNNQGSSFDLAQNVLDAFGSSITVANETHAFRCHESRGLDGFVDGTENPKGEEDIHRIGIIGNDRPDAGGSYVLMQRYRHDLKKWNTYSLKEQEEAVARSKADDIEFEKADRHPRSHIARTNLKENGVGLKIVRRSLPYGTASGEHGLAFIAYCASLHNIEVQLLSMFGESEDKQTDLLLERLTTAVSGAYYFAPSLERLNQLQA